MWWETREMRVMPALDPKQAAENVRAAIEALRAVVNDVHADARSRVKAADLLIKYSTPSLPRVTPEGKAAGREA